MNRTIVLDSGVLGMVTHPRLFQDEKDWRQSLLETGDGVFIPDIADYEVRRELLRANRLASVRLLDFLGLRLGSLPITTETLRIAAELWAEARQRGRLTAPDAALDGDVILCAQVRQLEADGNEVFVATDNLRHVQ